MRDNITSVWDTLTKTWDAVTNWGVDDAVSIGPEVLEVRRFPPNRRLQALFVASSSPVFLMLYPSFSFSLPNLSFRSSALPPSRTTRQLIAIVLGAALSLVVALPATAQDKRVGDTYYVRLGTGITDYAGDSDGTPGGDRITGTRDFLFDGEKFTETEIFPAGFSAEVGYCVSSLVDLGVSYHIGQYAFVDGPSSTSAPGAVSSGADYGTRRHTVQLLSRYTFYGDAWTLAPYVDGGLSATFGGNTAGIGPAFGLGVDVLLGSRTSLFVEARSSIVANDDAAVDGLDTGTPVDVLSQAPAFGLRYAFRSGSFRRP